MQSLYLSFFYTLLRIKFTIYLSVSIAEMFASLQIIKKENKRNVVERIEKQLRNS